MRLLQQRTQALESRSLGVGPESSGAASSPIDSPPARVVPAAFGTGWKQTWSPQEWEAWRSG
eukprot:7492206-Alexandrium_andersonii.AAC.1